MGEMPGPMGPSLRTGMHFIFGGPHALKVAVFCSPTETVPIQLPNQPTSNVTASNITVVTAYFNLGAFRKVQVNNILTKKTYDNWSEVFKYILNPVIVYTDSYEFADRMSYIRRFRNETTKIIVIQRNSSWAFNLRDRIFAIYSQKGYPKHYPNTVLPEYACSQIAKYDVLGRAAQDNTFNTDYFMWLDIGYFRNRTSTTPFRLKRPPYFKEKMVAMNLIRFNANLALSPEVIFKKNLLWIGGGIVFANRLTILAFEYQFRQAVEYFMSLSLMNSDQQIIYAMFSVEGRRVLKPATEIQLYKPPTEYNWFYLGFFMLHEESP
ncbi:uncharacterized protein LOC127840556 [Dreissena polymorpha]|uniref:uncharacterized protein LOC127840556 n=1 Tax=Dreissena polymorpha TaxID=45954 RepID=UPI0022647860|nr:uncharacterized protein LOC127840556 [Dreissena polymorpha]